MKYQNFLGKGFTVQFIDSTAMKQMLVHVRLMKNVFELNLFKMFQSELIKLVNESFYVVLIGHTMQSFINRIVCCEILPFDKKKLSSCYSPNRVIMQEKDFLLMIDLFYSNRK